MMASASRGEVSGPRGGCLPGPGGCLPGPGGGSLVSARNCGGDTGNGAGTIENNGSWGPCPCLGSV